MALETVRVDVATGAYAKIGDNITALSAKERSLDGFIVVAQATGAAAPTYNDGHSVNVDGEFTYSGSAADIYVQTPTSKVVELEIIRS